MLKEPVLTIANLSKKYNDHWAVQDLNITVNRGEIYGFLGRNGAGKTTTIRMIMDLIKPTRGDIQLFGVPKTNLGKDLFRRIGATIEYPGFYPNLTAKENLYYNAKMFEIKPSRINEVLNFMGLTAAANRVVKGFSLGMKQRLGLARALLHSPDFLILDEPTNGLDPAGIKEIRDIIKNLNREQNITIFVSSHILSEVEQMATRVGIIHNGTLAEEITLEEMHRQGQRYLELKVSDPQIAITVIKQNLAMQKIDLLENGYLHVYGQLDQPALVNRLLLEAGLEVSHLTLHQETLEDRFMRITGGEE
ncbi:ABC transporter ATP-binding protein [Desulforamulus aeronauticus]|uniref:Bacitracin transport system ATP-binding protein n=1 Tax=Desulforamulus aeronauticus DSM 10349 TaxID=1121421 RepID=A0A1M6NAT7_9FIRM|nr:ABC transporter ATP-binding protein [Desulforamulus aeronauticus]SHJ92791.1 bacitracin transport system ATP-binding protein [Desulforamulus aeronauticus DSM 10349]